MSLLPLRMYQKVHAKTTRPYTGCRGIYVSLQPTPQSIRTLLAWAKELLPNITVAPEKFHCTIMYSKVTPCVKVVIDPQMDYLARLDHFEYWDGHDGDGYLVAILNSPSIGHLHKQWLARGAVHSFEDFTPHVTLLDKFRPGKALLDRMVKMNKNILQPRYLSFARETLEDLKG